MKEANNIVKLKTHRFSIDWTYDEEVEINLDDYAFFECDFRLDSWHLIGHKYDDKTKKWSTKELSIHWCFEGDIAEFIYQANKYASEKNMFHKVCKVSRFNNLHYSSGFYKSLQNIFDIVKRMEEADTPTKQRKEDGKNV